MKTVFTCEFGSKLYGTMVPTSDIDYKSIFIPEAKSLLLQRAQKTIQNNTKYGSKTKNNKDDIDIEKFSLQQYLKLLCENQTVALDMLFAPKELILETSDIWEQIRFNKEKFLHKEVGAFYSYAKQQAAKYGLKGNRVSALRTTISMLTGLDDYKKLFDYEELFTNYVDSFTSHKDPLVKYVFCKAPNGQLEKHLEIVNRKFPMHATVKYVISVLQKIFNEYGHRALLAEKNEGIDWKALMHAVRVSYEAEELLLTGNITFPRPEREVLLSIRTGKLDYKEVELMIEMGLEKIERAKTISNLRSIPDVDFCDNFIYNVYLREFK